MADMNLRLPAASELGPGRYSDGHPLDEVHYLEGKIILKPDRFTSTKSFRHFAKIVERVADETDVDFSPGKLDRETLQIREVVFLDTADFRLYNNAFILRRRILYRDGFPVGDPEVVFKFRHPDMQKSAELDVRPQIPGAARIKFKAEALPLRDQLGGFRVLYSHSAEFGLSDVRHEGRTSMTTLARVFPCLTALQSPDDDRVELVNQTVVEEVLLALGKLDFGKGVKAKTDVALWRERGRHLPLAGEYSFQARFDRPDELQAKARRRCERFFIGLQWALRDWVSLGTTKTGIVYRLKGNPPQSHE